MKKDLLLAIDVGTGSVRAALINLSGETVAFSAQEHDQIVPSVWLVGAAARILVGRCGSERANRARQNRSGGWPRCRGGRLRPDAWHSPD